MSGGSSHQSIDPFRKSLIVALLVGALVALYSVAAPSPRGFDPTAMLALGFVILASYTIGQLVEVVRLPHITGYLLAGMVLGPSVASVLPEAWRIPPFDRGLLSIGFTDAHGRFVPGVQDQLQLLNTLAIGLIALTAGGELQLGALRKGFRSIVGMLAGQVTAMFFVITGLVVALTQLLPAVLPQAMGSLSLLESFALGLVISAVAAATSPPMTIAVVNGAQADGPMTRTVLGAVVLQDVVVFVLFSTVTAFAASFLGGQSIDGGLVNYLLVHIGGSMVAGAFAALILGAYVRYVGNEILLFLVGLIYVGSYFGHQLHLDPVLMFIAAGFVIGNFSSSGDTLIHEVERLSLPVYVVFFTLTGAHLDLTAVAAIAPAAVIFVSARLVAAYVGVSAGAKLAGAPPTVQRYGWTAFASQAGIALALANKISGAYGDPGDAASLGPTVATLLVSMVAMNEMMGPIILKVGLGRAGEIGTAKPAAETSSALDPETLEIEDSRLPSWQPPVPIEDPWGPRSATGSRALDRLVDDVEGELQGVVRDLADGPLRSFRDEASNYLRTLRREFLRHQRRAVVQLQAKGADPQRVLRGEQADLARRWRAAVLDRAASTSRETWSPVALVEVLDQLADSLPAEIEAPWDPSSWTPRPSDGPLRRSRRALLRARRRWHRLGGGELPLRSVPVRDLGRYHLAGAAPARLEALAALFVAAQSHLAARTRSLFDGVVSGYEGVIERLQSDPTADAEALLLAVRAEVEEEFGLAAEELEQVVRDGIVRGTRVLGGSLKDLKRDLPIAATHELPSRSRRFSLVYNQRVAAIEKLGAGLDAGRRTLAARFTVLALELEIVGLERQLKEAIHEHGGQFSRMVRGRGPKQLERVDHALGEALDAMEAHLATSMTGLGLAAAVRADAEPLARVVGEAAREALRLRDHLANQESIGPLVDALLQASQVLTERYTVPTGPAAHGEWTLPAAVHTTEVPFREVVLAWIESVVARQLSDLTHRLTDDVNRLAQVLEELERIVAFNVELAGAELEVLQDEHVPEETAELVREMVVGALLRSRGRLAAASSEAAELPRVAEHGLRDAVLGGLHELRSQIVDGRVAELRLRLLREAAQSRNLARQARHLGDLLNVGAERAILVARGALGEDRVAGLRVALGLPDPTPGGVQPTTFAAPKPAEHLPLVYRRLFSDQALEAGDLLTGRQSDIARARGALLGASGGRFRAVAVIGQEGVGKGAVVNALVRNLKPRPTRVLNLDGPATVAEVAAWFEGAGEGNLIVFSQVELLFRMRPGGFEPLHRFVEGIIADGGKNAWMVACAETVWDYAARVAPLADAFPDVVRLRPLDAAELEAAVIARHAMSGYGLAFDAQDDLGWQVRHWLARGADQQARRREAWFKSLHDATGGVVHDALLLWQASIRKVDELEGVVRVGPVDRPPIVALRALAEDVTLTLRQALRQGWLDERLHAELFQLEPHESRAHLAHLLHLGLLESGPGGRVRVPIHLRAPMHAVLAERGWME